MSTAPIVPVVPAPTSQQKFESALAKVGETIEKIINAGVNIGEQEQGPIEALLPPAAGAEFSAVLSAAATQVAAVDAKYAALGQTNVPFGVKVAEAVAIGGLGVLAVAAQAGFTVSAGSLPTLFGAAYQIFANLNLAKLTAAPAAPAAAAPAAS